MKHYVKSQNRPRESKKRPRSHSLSVANLPPTLETALTRPRQAPQLSQLRTDTLATSRGEKPPSSAFRIRAAGGLGSANFPQPISSQV